MSQKFSDWATMGTLAGTEKLVGLDSGANAYTTPDDLKAYMFDASWKVKYDTFAGYGSTNTKIPYFTNKNTDTSAGDVTLSNSSTNGLSATIISDGLYFVSYWEESANGGQYVGLSINSSQLTTAIYDITNADKLAFGPSGYNSSDFTGFVSWSGPLVAGDVVRPHTAGVSISTAPASRSGFIINRLL